MVYNIKCFLEIYKCKVQRCLLFYDLFYKDAWGGNLICIWPFLSEPSQFITLIVPFPLPFSSYEDDMAFTLLCTENNLVPFQFPQIDLSPFFVSLTKISFVQSSGICSSSHILFRRWQNLSVEMLSNAFIASGGMLSTPPAYRFSDVWLRRLYLIWLYM